MHTIASKAQLIKKIYFYNFRYRDSIIEKEVTPTHQEVNDLLLGKVSSRKVSMRRERKGRPYSEWV